MKKLITIGVLSFITSTAIFTDGYSQDKDTLTYSELAGESKMGFGKESKKYDVYISQNGTVYKIGDTLKIGTPSSNKTFAFIFSVKGGPLAEQQVSRLDISAEGTKTKIYRVDIRGNKRTGYLAVFKTQSAIGGRFFGSYFIEIENAIKSGEIVSSVLTSDQALNELEKLKKELDLGLITQDQFDKKKAELVKYINVNN